MHQKVRFFARDAQNDRARASSRAVVAPVPAKQGMAIRFCVMINGDLRSNHVLGVDTGTIRESKCPRRDSPVPRRGKHATD